MYPRGSIYNTPNRKWRVDFKNSQVLWKAKSQDIQESMRKNPKTFGFMHISLCMWVLAQKLRIHVSIALKVVYAHKTMFFGDFLGRSKYNKSKGGPRHLHKDMEGHKYVINHVWQNQL